MALIFDGMTCVICDQPLDINGPIVATSHFIGDESDPLWHFSDAAMHDDCFQNWEQREAFVQRFNATVGEMTLSDGTRHRMNPDGRIVLVKASDRR